MKKGKTKIPDGTTSVRNAVTKDTKYWCAMCGKWGNHRSGGCPELKPRTSPCNVVR